MFPTPPVISSQQQQSSTLRLLLFDSELETQSNTLTTILSQLQHHHQHISFHPAFAAEKQERLARLIDQPDHKCSDSSHNPFHSTLNPPSQHCSHDQQQLIQFDETLSLYPVSTQMHENSVARLDQPHYYEQFQKSHRKKHHMRRSKDEKDEKDEEGSSTSVSYDEDGMDSNGDIEFSPDEDHNEPEYHSRAFQYSFFSPNPGDHVQDNDEDDNDLYYDEESQYMDGDFDQEGQLRMSDTSVPNSARSRSKYSQSGQRRRTHQQYRRTVQAVSNQHQMQTAPHFSSNPTPMKLNTPTVTTLHQHPNNGQQFLQTTIPPRSPHQPHKLVVENQLAANSFNQNSLQPAQSQSSVYDSNNNPNLTLTTGYTYTNEESASWDLSSKTSSKDQLRDYSRSIAVLERPEYSISKAVIEKPGSSGKERANSRRLRKRSKKALKSYRSLLTESNIEIEREIERENEHEESLTGGHYPAEYSRSKAVLEAPIRDPDGSDGYDNRSDDDFDSKYSDGSDYLYDDDDYDDGTDDFDWNDDENDKSTELSHQSSHLSSVLSTKSSHHHQTSSIPPLNKRTGLSHTLDPVETVEDDDLQSVNTQRIQLDDFDNGGYSETDHSTDQTSLASHHSQIARESPSIYRNSNSMDLYTRKSPKRGLGEFLGNQQHLHQLSIAAQNAPYNPSSPNSAVNTSPQSTFGTLAGDQLSSDQITGEVENTRENELSYLEYDEADYQYEISKNNAYHSMARVIGSADMIQYDTSSSDNDVTDEIGAEINEMDQSDSVLEDERGKSKNSDKNKKFRPERSISKEITHGAGKSQKQTKDDQSQVKITDEPPKVKKHRHFPFFLRRNKQDHEELTHGMNSDGKHIDKTVSKNDETHNNKGKQVDKSKPASPSPSQSPPQHQHQHQCQQRAQQLSIDPIATPRNDIAVSVESHQASSSNRPDQPNQPKCGNNHLKTAQAAQFNTAPALPSSISKGAELNTKTQNQPTSPVSTTNPSTPRTHHNSNTPLTTSRNNVGEAATLNPSKVQLSNTKAFEMHSKLIPVYQFNHGSSVNTSFNNFSQPHNSLGSPNASFPTNFLDFQQNEFISTFNTAIDTAVDENYHHSDVTSDPTALTNPLFEPEITVNQSHDILSIRSHSVAVQRPVFHDVHSEAGSNRTSSHADYFSGAINNNVSDSDCITVGTDQGKLKPIFDNYQNTSATPDEQYNNMSPDTTNKVSKALKVKRNSILSVDRLHRAHDSQLHTNNLTSLEQALRNSTTAGRGKQQHWSVDFYEDNQSLIDLHHDVMELRDSLVFHRDSVLFDHDGDQRNSFNFPMRSTYVKGTKGEYSVMDDIETISKAANGPNSRLQFHDAQANSINFVNSIVIYNLPTVALNSGVNFAIRDQTLSTRPPSTDQSFHTITTTPHQPDQSPVSTNDQNIQNSHPLCAPKNSHQTSLQPPPSSTSFTPQTRPQIPPRPTIAKPLHSFTPQPPTSMPSHQSHNQSSTPQLSSSIQPAFIKSSPTPPPSTFPIDHHLKPPHPGISSLKSNASHTSQIARLFRFFNTKSCHFCAISHFFLTHPYQLYASLFFHPHFINATFDHNCPHIQTIQIHQKRQHHHKNSNQSQTPENAFITFTPRYRIPTPVIPPSPTTAIYDFLLLFNHINIFQQLNHASLQLGQFIALLSYPSTKRELQRMIVSPLTSFQNFTLQPPQDAMLLQNQHRPRRKQSTALSPLAPPESGQTENKQQPLSSTNSISSLVQFIGQVTSILLYLQIPQVNDVTNHIYYAQQEMLDDFRAKLTQIEPLPTPNNRFTDTTNIQYQEHNLSAIFQNNRSEAKLNKRIIPSGQPSLNQITTSTISPLTKLQYQQDNPALSGTTSNSEREIQNQEQKHESSANLAHMLFSYEQLFGSGLSGDTLSPYVLNQGKSRSRVDFDHLSPISSFSIINQQHTLITSPKTPPPPDVIANPPRNPSTLSLIPLVTTNDVLSQQEIAQLDPDFIKPHPKHQKVGDPGTQEPATFSQLKPWPASQQARSNRISSNLSSATAKSRRSLSNIHSPFDPDEEGVFSQLEDQFLLTDILVHASSSTLHAEHDSISPIPPDQANSNALNSLATSPIPPSVGINLRQQISTFDITSPTTHADPSDNDDDEQGDEIYDEVEHDAQLATYGSRQNLTQHVQSEKRLKHDETNDFHDFPSTLSAVSRFTYSRVISRQSRHSSLHAHSVSQYSLQHGNLDTFAHLLVSDQGSTSNAELIGTDSSAVQLTDQDHGLMQDLMLNDDVAKPLILDFSNFYSDSQPIPHQPQPSQPMASLLASDQQVNSLPTSSLKISNSISAPIVPPTPPHAKMYAVPHPNLIPANETDKNGSTTIDTPKDPHNALALQVQLSPTPLPPNATQAKRFNSNTDDFLTPRMLTPAALSGAGGFNFLPVPIDQSNGHPILATPLNQTAQMKPIPLSSQPAVSPTTDSTRQFDPTAKNAATASTPAKMRYLHPLQVNSSSSNQTPPTHQATRSHHDGQYEYSTETVGSSSLSKSNHDHEIAANQAQSYYNNKSTQNIFNSASTLRTNPNLAKLDLTSSTSLDTLSPPSNSNQSKIASNIILSPHVVANNGSGGSGKRLQLKRIASSQESVYSPTVQQPQFTALTNHPSSIIEQQQSPRQTQSPRSHTQSQSDAIAFSPIVPNSPGVPQSLSNSIITIHSPPIHPITPHTISKSVNSLNASLPSPTRSLDHDKLPFNKQHEFIPISDSHTLDLPALSTQLLTHSPPPPKTYPTNAQKLVIMETMATIFDRLHELITHHQQPQQDHYRVINNSYYSLNFHRRKDRLYIISTLMKQIMTILSTLFHLVLITPPPAPNQTSSLLSNAAQLHNQHQPPQGGHAHDPIQSIPLNTAIHDQRTAHLIDNILNILTLFVTLQPRGIL